MHLTIDYRTDYRFSQPQTRIIQLLRVTPDSHAGQIIVNWTLDVECDARLRNHVDGYGNKVTMLYVPGPVDHVSVNVWGEVFTDDTAGVIRDAPEPLPPAIFLRSTPLSRPNGAIVDLATRLAEVEKDELSRLHLLNRELNRRMRFDPGKTQVDTDAGSAFEAGHGVCQDFAHIFCAAARAMGTPARYVSGHLFRRDGLEEQPAAHAWTEAYVTGFGWIAFDPANGICGDDAYVRVATGLDYAAAAPLSGARTGGGHENLSVAVRVSMSQSQQQN
ncbi:transglutaminase family protein [Sphingomonas colocasiae]|uniref:Transglutaminase family protein n=1 Tax=Sphingomonas colocasiae TaxID=1848973 RepID=A0ABS7PMH0_9SPHN|nr:transglutaminase family protein [Sphingomonas colocasiae]MBY8822507.1 transglutaminase family protein [Sphingomonas colocasiae]